MQTCYGDNAVNIFKYDAKHTGKNYIQGETIFLKQTLRVSQPCKHKSFLHRNIWSQTDICYREGERGLWKWIYKKKKMLNIMNTGLMQYKLTLTQQHRLNGSRMNNIFTIIKGYFLK